MTALLSVSAVGAQGDVLMYAWSSSCPGTFLAADQAFPTFTLAASPTASSCEFDVTVTDVEFPDGPASGGRNQRASDHRGSELLAGRRQRLWWLWRARWWARLNLRCLWQLRLLRGQDLGELRRSGVQRLRWLRHPRPRAWRDLRGMRQLLVQRRSILGELL